MDQEKIGRFIQERRKLKKITQQELAEKLGVSDRTVGNWENGRNMPDLSLFKPLCDILDISINDLMSAEKVDKKDYQDKLEENIITTIDYTSKKLNTKNNIIGTILLMFGVIISITAIGIFPSDSSWGSIYSVIGAIIALIGIAKFTKKLTYPIRLLCNFGFFILYVGVLFLIDYIGVISLNQPPRFSTVKISTGTNERYFDTVFYDVYTCDNKNYIVVPNQSHEIDDIYKLCGDDE